MGSLARAAGWVEVQVGAGADAAGSRSAGLAGGAILGVATGLATALGYAFTVVLARGLTVADYGALVALLGAGLIGTIPAAGFQYVVARRTVALTLPAGRNDGSSLQLAALAGVGLLAAAAAIAPLAESWLHLHSVQPMLALAVALVPLTLSGAFQGALLGHGRFGALGAMYVVAAAARLAGGVLTVLAGWGVTGAICSLAAAALVSTAFGWLLTGPRSWRRGGDRVQPLARDVLQACSTVAGILVLTNTDVLLARHYLDAETSGAYAIASLFAKAMLWLSQFVAQAAYPALAGSGGRHRLLLRTLAGTAGVGLVGVAGTALFGGALVRQATGGTEYGVSTGLLTAFALLGVAWSLAQVLLLAAIAVGDRRPGRLLWALIAAEAGLVAAAAHGSPGEILAVCMVAVLAFVAVVAVLEWTWPPAAARKPGPPLPAVPAADPATAVGPGMPASPGMPPPDPDRRTR